MYVCLCNAVTDRDIRAAVVDGATTLSDQAESTGAATGCGCCRATVERVIDDELGRLAFDAQSYRAA